MKKGSKMSKAQRAKLSRARRADWRRRRGAGRKPRSTSRRITSRTGINFGRAQVVDLIGMLNLRMRLLVQRRKALTALLRTL